MTYRVNQPPATADIGTGLLTSGRQDKTLRKGDTKMSRTDINSTDLMAENIHLMQELTGMTKRIDNFNAWLDTFPFENSTLTVCKARQAIAGNQPTAPRKPCYGV